MVTSPAPLHHYIVIQFIEICHVRLGVATEMYLLIRGGVGVVKFGVVYRTDLGSLLSSLEPTPKSILITKGKTSTPLKYQIQQLHNLNNSIGTTILITLHYSYAIELPNMQF